MYRVRTYKGLALGSIKSNALQIRTGTHLPLGQEEVPTKLEKVRTPDKGTSWKALSPSTLAPGPGLTPRPGNSHSRPFSMTHLLYNLKGKPDPFEPWFLDL